MQPRSEQNLCHDGTLPMRRVTGNLVAIDVRRIFLAARVFLQHRRRRLVTHTDVEHLC